MLAKVLRFLTGADTPLKRAAKDPWLYTMMLAVAEKFNDPKKGEDDQFVRAIQQWSDSSRKALAERVSKPMMRIADSENRILACREWVRDVVHEYAPLRVIFTGNANYDEEVTSGLRHSCNFGLHEHIDEVVKVCWADELAKSGSLQETKDFLQLLSLRCHFELDLANLGRVALNDQVEGKGNWFRFYFGSTVAFAELELREQLGWTNKCDTNAVWLEQQTIEQNLLKGYPDPLEDVPFAAPGVRFLQMNDKQSDV